MSPFSFILAMPVIGETKKSHPRPKQGTPSRAVISIETRRRLSQGLDMLTAGARVKDVAARFGYSKSWMSTLMCQLEETDPLRQRYEALGYGSKTARLERMARVVELLELERIPVAQAARRCGVVPSSFYSYLDKHPETGLRDRWLCIRGELQQRARG